jgi:hypothetical protein
MTKRTKRGGGGVKAFLEKKSPIMKGNLKDGMPRNMLWWEVYRYQAQVWRQR